jgi:hypothetical protein
MIMARLNFPQLSAGLLLLGTSSVVPPAHAVATLAHSACNARSGEIRANIAYGQYGVENRSTTHEALVACGGDLMAAGRITWLGVYDRNPSFPVSCTLHYLDKETNLSLFSVARTTADSSQTHRAEIYWLGFQSFDHSESVPVAECSIPPATSFGISHITSFWF